MKPVLTIDDLNEFIRESGEKPANFCNLIGIKRHTYYNWVSKGNIPFLYQRIYLTMLRNTQGGIYEAARIKSIMGKQQKELCNEK